VGEGKFRHPQRRIGKILQQHIDRAAPSVLPRGRNFGRKAQKGPKKIWWGRESQGPNFYPIYQKGRKGAELFLVLVFHKIIYISCQKLGLKTGLINFSLPFWIMDH
jgi:hypothetical protein